MWRKQWESRKLLFEGPVFGDVKKKDTFFLIISLSRLSLLNVFADFFSLFKISLKKKVCTPNVGLGLTMLRSRVSWSTD